VRAKIKALSDLRELRKLIVLEHEIPKQEFCPSDSLTFKNRCRSIRQAEAVDAQLLPGLHNGGGSSQDVLVL